MTKMDWPLLFVAASSLVGLGVQHHSIKYLNGRVDSLLNTENDVASLKLQYSVLHEEMEKLQKLATKDIAATRPFTKIDGWWEADADMFRFPQGIVVGDRNDDCAYGEATLSVGLIDEYGYGGNCPSGKGSVTFGYRNTASGNYSSVTGGAYNLASSRYSSVSGGTENVSSGDSSSVSGGSRNNASGSYSSVLGGYSNTASGLDSSVTGGSNNKATGT